MVLDENDELLTLFTFPMTSCRLEKVNFFQLYCVFPFSCVTVSEVDDMSNPSCASCCSWRINLFCFFSLTRMPRSEGRHHFIKSYEVNFTIAEVKLLQTAESETIAHWDKAKQISASSTITFAAHFLKGIIHRWKDMHAPSLKVYHLVLLWAVMWTMAMISSLKSETGACFCSADSHFLLNPICHSSFSHHALVLHCYAESRQVVTMLKAALMNILCITNGSK